MISHEEWQIIAQAVFELENSDKFLQYTNEISDSLSAVIKKDYEQGANEPRIVEDLSNEINLVQTASDNLDGYVYQENHLSVLEREDN